MDIAIDALGGLESALRFLMTLDVSELDWAAISTDLERRRQMIQTAARIGADDPTRLEELAQPLDVLARLQARVSEIRQELGQ